MILRKNKDGTVSIVWTGKQLKDRRMWIRARIPIVVKGIEQDTLERLIQLKVPPSIFDDFDCMCCVYCKTHDEYMRELRLFARRVGIRHWRLGPPEEPPWRDSYDDGCNPPDPAAWWR